MQRHAVHRRGHAVLADAVMDEAAGIVGGAHRLHRLGAGVVGAGEVGRAADHFRHRRDRGSRARIRRPCGWRCPSASAASFSFTARTASSSAARQVALHAALEFGALAGVERGEPLAPVGVRGLASAAPASRQAARMSAGISNGACAPAELLARALISSAPSGEPCARRLAGLGRRAEADGGLAGDQHRPVGRLALSRAPRRSPPDRGRRRARRSSRRPRSASPDRRCRRATARRRSRCRCRRTARSARLSFRWPASAIASWLMPSIRSPSEAST